MASSWYRRNYGHTPRHLRIRSSDVGLALLVVAFVALVIYLCIMEHREQVACEDSGGTWATRNCHYTPAGKSWIYTCDHYCQRAEAP